MYPKREGRRAASSWPALTLLAIATLTWSIACPQAPAARAAGPPSPRALVDQYCVVCHSQKTSTAGVCLEGLDLDRKSTRLNSSHLVISYAVFCLKKKQ